MTPEQFEVVSKLIRSRDPVKSALKRVIFDGVTPTIAAQEFNLFPTSVFNSKRRYEAADTLIRGVYNLGQL
jgi:hypothetical protein